MRSTRKVIFSAAIAALLCPLGQTAVRADELAEQRAVRLVEEAGGTLVRDDARLDKPVVAISLCGAKLSDELLQNLAVFPSLRILDLCQTDGLTSKRVKYLAEIKELQTLTLARCPRVTGHGLYKLSALKQLRNLDVSYCAELDDCGLEAMVEFFPHLKVLDISGCKSVTARGLHELRNMKELESLTVANCDFTDTEMKEIAAVASLKRLSVPGNPRTTYVGLKSFAALTSLESLDMSGLQGVTSATLAGLRNLPNLHTLSIADCPRIANHSLKILTTLKQLKHLNIAGCPTMQNYGLEYIVQSMPGLESLSLAGCDGINDEGIKQLTHLQHLKSLNLKRCRNVSEGGAKVVADALPKVQIDR